MDWWSGAEEGGVRASGAGAQHNELRKDKAKGSTGTSPRKMRWGVSPFLHSPSSLWICSWTEITRGPHYGMFSLTAVGSLLGTEDGHHKSTLQPPPLSPTPRGPHSNRSRERKTSDK